MSDQPTVDPGVHGPRNSGHTLLIGTTRQGRAAMFDATSQAVLGCPHCHAKPRIAIPADPTDGPVLIRCHEHPEVRVWVMESSLEEAVTSWNDSGDWARIGTTETNATMLATRPSYNVDLDGVKNG